MAAWAGTIKAETADEGAMRPGVAQARNPTAVHSSTHYPPWPAHPGMPELSAGINHSESNYWNSACRRIYRIT